MAVGGLDAFAWFGIFGLLGFGALNTLTTKIQFTMSSVGAEGSEKLFEKPFFAVFTMFVAMACVLFWHYGFEFMERKKKREQAAMKSSPLSGPSPDPLLPGEEKKGLSEFWSFMYVGIPATLDLVATCLMFYGLLFLSASIYQMLRGAMIVFSAIISVPLLGKKLYRFNWFGVCICVVGIACVGTSNYLNTQNGGDSGPKVTPEQSLMGVGFVLAAQVVQAAQVVTEEKFLKEVNIAPFKIVGFEGVWGCILCICLLFPVVGSIPGKDDGVLEDTSDTFVMMSNSTILQALVFLYVFSCSTYNAAGMAVTSSFSAVHRTMLEASRTAVIWGFDLFIHYCVDKTASFGEAWLPFSWLQLVGFLVVVTGQMIYGEILRVPGFYYPPKNDDMDVNPSKFESPTQMMLGVSPLPKDRD